jgi:SAM-dependent methyltransferase
VDQDQRSAREQTFHDDAYAKGGRSRVGKYYAIDQAAEARFHGEVLRDCAGSRVLEYGCGTGSAAFDLAACGASVTGIDISPVAIEQAARAAKERGLSARFLVMDAEHLEFSDGAFDLVCGSGILHHLDISSALSEIARVLTRDGRAVFLEPLGHNPLINAYRRRTPHLRTADEHPLLVGDLELVERFFTSVELRFFDFLTIGAVPLRRHRGFRRLVATLALADRGLFRILPALRKHAWRVVISAEGPRRHVAP